MSISVGRPCVSVVVCAYNGATTLPTVLRALQEQTLETALYEVVVIDDGSTDGTSGVAAAHGARVVRLPRNGGVAAARNTGIEHARGPLIAFTDADCEPAPDWLAQFVGAFDDPSVDGAGGRVVPASESTPTLRYLAVMNPLMPLPATLLESASPMFRLKTYLGGLANPTRDIPRGSDLYSLVTANCAVKAELVRELGGFDPRFRVGEDGDLSRRAHKRTGGVRFIYCEGALVRHRFESGFKDTLRRAHSYGKSNARLAAHHDDVHLIIYPFPAAGAALAVYAVAKRARWTLAAATLLPLGAYFGWACVAVRQRKLEPLVYAYMQLAQETATLVGEGASLYRARRGRT